MVNGSEVFIYNVATNVNTTASILENVQISANTTTGTSYYFKASLVEGETLDYSFPVLPSSGSQFSIHGRESDLISYLYHDSFSYINSSLFIYLFIYFFLEIISSLFEIA